MRCLYRNGSSVRPQNLFESIVSGDKKFFQQLTSGELQHDILNQKERVNQYDLCTPLGSGLYFGETDMVKKLIQLGADVHLKFKLSRVCV